MSNATQVSIVSESSVVEMPIDENGMEVSDGSSNPIIFLQKNLRLVKWPKFALQIEFLQISYSHELKHLETFSILGKNSIFM